MPAEGARRLGELLGSSYCFLEYGAGGSTMLAAQLGVPRIHSVESDSDFLDAVANSVARSGSKSQFNPHYVDIGPTKEWGYPVDHGAVARWPNYSLQVWDALQAQGILPNLVLVDGRFRVACALATILHGHEGTIIFLDDYVGREEKYQAIGRYARLEEIVGIAAIFRTVPLGTKAAAIAGDFARHCVTLD